MSENTRIPERDEVFEQMHIQDIGKISNNRWNTITFAHTQWHWNKYINNRISNSTFIVVDRQPISLCLLVQEEYQTLIIWWLPRNSFVIQDSWIESEASQTDKPATREQNVKHSLFFCWLKLISSYHSEVRRSVTQEFKFCTKESKLSVTNLKIFWASSESSKAISSECSGK